MFSWIMRCIRTLVSGFRVITYTVVTLLGDTPGMAKTMEKSIIEDFMYFSLSFNKADISPAFVSAQLRIYPRATETPNQFWTRLVPFLGFVPQLP